MKKIIGLSLILLTLSIGASAQVGIRKQRLGRSFNRVEITRSERTGLRNDAVRYQMIQRRAYRDGVVTPVERKRLHRAKAKGRRDLFRYRHNPRRRLI